MLRGAKGIKAENEASKLIDTFVDHLSAKPKDLVEKSVRSSMVALNNTRSEISDQCDAVKSAYAVYNTASFLKQDNVASIELISEMVALQASHVARQTTQTAQHDARQQLTPPNYLNAAQLIANADKSGVWDSWQLLNEQLGGTL